MALVSPVLIAAIVATADNSPRDFDKKRGAMNIVHPISFLMATGVTIYKNLSNERRAVASNGIARLSFSSNNHSKL